MFFVCNVIILLTYLLAYLYPFVDLFTTPSASALVLWQRVEASTRQKQAISFC